MNYSTNRAASRIAWQFILFFCMSVLFILPYKLAFHLQNNVIFGVALIAFLIQDRNAKIGAVKQVMALIAVFVLLEASALIRGEDLYSGEALATGFILALVPRERPFTSSLFVGLLFTISLISLSLQFLLFRYDDRPVLSILDPNFSSMLILLFFFFCVKHKFLLGIALCFAAVFFLLSRDYLYSLIIFSVLSVLRRPLWNIMMRFRINTFFKTAVITALLSFVLSFVYVIKLDVKSVEGYVGYDKSIGRYANVFDSSNFQRFIANLFYANELRKPEVLLMGYGEKYVSYYRENVHNIMHNSYFSLSAYYGLPFALLYLYLLSSRISPFFTKENLPYIFTALFFMCFLHTMLSGPVMVMLFTILALPERQRKQKLRTCFYIGPVKCPINEY